IGDIQTGDMVMAEDPVTGARGPHQVDHLIVGQGLKHLVDVDIDGAKITTTDNHPFWVESQHRWLEAKDLKPGDVVLQADQRPATVRTVHAYDKVQRVNNLTVADLHTYFVMAGLEPVLVHNSNCSVNARILGKALEAAGFVREEGVAAHHIV